MRHWLLLLTLLPSVAQVAAQAASDSNLSATSGPEPRRVIAVARERFESIETVARLYEQAGYPVLKKPEHDLTVFRISQSEAEYIFTPTLEYACAQMAKAAGVTGVVLRNGAKVPDDAAFIRKQVAGKTVGAVILAGRANYEIWSGMYGRQGEVEIPAKAAAVDFQDELKSAFELAGAFISPAAMAQAPTGDLRHRIPAVECLPMRAWPADLTLGFQALPLFLSGIRCEPPIHGSQTACFAVVLGSLATKRVVDKALDPIYDAGAQERQRQQALREQGDRQTTLAREQEERTRLASAISRISTFRRSIRDATETNCGPVLQVKLALVKVYFPVKDYGNEHWIKLDQIYTTDYACKFINGQYQPPAM